MNNPYLLKATRAMTNAKRNGTRARRRSRSRHRMNYWLDQTFHYSIKSLRLERQQYGRAGLPKAYVVALL